MSESHFSPGKELAAVSWHKTSSFRLFAIGAVSCIAFAFAINTINLGSVLDAAKQLSAVTILIVGGLLFLGTLLAALRLWFMASDLGHSLSARDTMLALGVGQLVGSLTVQYFGQIAARSALLGPRGFSPPANIVLVTYERFIAAAVSAAMAIAGAWFLFGHIVLDRNSGGDHFIKILAGLASAIIASAMFGWGPAAVKAIRHRPGGKVAVSVVRSVVLTLGIQFCTVAAYVIGAHSLALDVTITNLIAGSVVVAFVSSLPISFAGWGVRELSTVLALGAIGVPNGSALTVAILVGALALTAVILIALIGVFLSPGHKSLSGPNAAVSEYPEIIPAVQFAIPLFTATAVFFQIFIPIGTTLVNVNLADPLAILGGSLFALYFIVRERPRWRLSWLNVHVMLATAVMALSFLYGYYSFGWSDWAFTNKLLGWFVLLCYGTTGALIVRVSNQGMTLLVRTFVGAAYGIVLLELFFIVLKVLSISMPTEFILLPLEGFSQNRNAFAFILVLAVCGTVLVSARIQIIVMGVLLSGIWFAGSRASFGALFAVLVLALFIRAFSIRNVVFGIAVAAVILLVVAALPYVPSFYTGTSRGSSGFDIMVFTMTPVSSDVDRFKSIADGLNLFLSHPLFGAGLGAYALDQGSRGQMIVVHSTPIWLLAETGLVGFLAFAVPAVRIFWTEWVRDERDLVGKMILLVLVTFGVMSLVHELMYQRALWLLLGAGLACIPGKMSGKRLKKPV